MFRFIFKKKEEFEGLLKFHNQQVQFPMFQKSIAIVHAVSKMLIANGLYFILFPSLYIHTLKRNLLKNSYGGFFYTL